MQNKKVKMDKKLLEKYRKRLLKIKVELIKKLLEDYNTSKSSEPEIAQDLADQAIDTYSKEFLYSLSDADRENLQMIDEALKKIEESSYGYCERCGKKISNKRLNVIPWAKYCIECQEKSEKGE